MDELERFDQDLRDALIERDGEVPTTFPDRPWGDLTLTQFESEVLTDALDALIASETDAEILETAKVLIMRIDMI